MARPLGELESAEHVCSFDAGTRVAAGFVAGALGAGDRILYVAAGREPTQVGGMLGEAGVDVRAPLRSGQLLVRTFADISGSASDPDLGVASARYRREADRARADGYPGLRAAVEMDTLVAVRGSPAELAGWERQVDAAVEQLGMTVLCQYDGRMFDASTRRVIAGEHDATALEDGTMPLARFGPGQSPGDLRVTGALDMATAASFARALRARTALDARVTIDFSHLRFADVAGLRPLFEVARELPRDHALVVRHSPPPVRRLLDVVRWSDPRVRIT